MMYAVLSVITLFLGALQTVLLIGKISGSSPLTWIETIAPLGLPALLVTCIGLAYLIVSALLYFLVGDTAEDKNNGEKS